MLLMMLSTRFSTAPPLNSLVTTADDFAQYQSADTEKIQG